MVASLSVNDTASWDPAVSGERLYRTPPGRSADFPVNYDDYNLRVVRNRLKYVCPIGAALYLLFFGWDILYIQSFALGAKVLAMRAAFTIAMLVFWRYLPRLQSLPTILRVVTALYVFALLDLIAILRLIPGGLLAGIPGFLLVIMCGSGMFSMDAVPALLAGSIGVAVYLGESFFSGVTYRDMAAEALFLTGGLLIGTVFLILLDRELRAKHSVEVSLEEEKEESEALLKEILPRYVIQRIRDGEEIIAEAVSEVNVIFIDMVGFTALSRRLAPGHLVEILGNIFKAFDEKCDEYGVTKIKTIGDAYMALTGVTEPSALSAVSAIEFCFEAIRSVEAVAAATGVPVSVRAGVATGAVISGVLSLKRPAYDLWGETVNLAARMESTGQPGRIHLSETTYWRIKDHFECDRCGLIDVKGIGPIQTFFVKAGAPARVDRTPEDAELSAAAEKAV